MNPFSQKRLSYIPHDNLDQFHGCFIQGLKKFQKDTSFFTHLPNDKAKSNTEYNKSQYVYSLWIRLYDFVVLGHILQREETIQFVQLGRGKNSCHLTDFSWLSRAMIKVCSLASLQGLQPID